MWAAILLPANGLQRSCFGQVESAPTAEGLLRGAILARTQIGSLRFNLEIETTTGDVTTKSEFRVEMLGDKRRFETPDEVSVCDGARRFTFTRKDNTDLVIMNESDAAVSHGSLAFDPRTIGLTDSHPSHFRVDDFIWVGEGAVSRVTGTENINGVRVWKVRSDKGDGTKEHWQEHWIDDQYFRVYRDIARLRSLEVDLICEYADDNKLAIPNLVTAKRTDGDYKMERTFRVSEIDTTPVSEDRFLMKTFELPINTAAIDYNLSKRIGYWDGTKLVPDYVRDARESSEPDEVPTNNAARFWLLASGTVFVLGLAAVLLFRRRSAGL